MFKSYKFRIYPSKITAQKFEHTLNLCRDLYNAALQERRDAWKLNRVSITFYDQTYQLKEIRQADEEYKNISSQVLTMVLLRAQKTFQSFFGRVKAGLKAGFPRFKNESRYNSFCFRQIGNALNGNKLRLSKIGTVKIKLSRAMIGKIKTLTIKKEVGKWFAIFAVETLPEPLPKTGKQIGIDVGVENFATLSDGTQIDNWKYYESSQKALRRAQRSVSRKTKGSANRKKAITVLRKIHQKIFNRRADFQHKLSTGLVKEFDVIVAEKLNVIGLSRSFLAKQIHDVSWSSFFNMLRYKAENADKQLIEVSPNWTSQDCSACGERVKKDLSVRVHNCKCGLKIHRDINAALNILRSGLDRLALSLPVGEFAKEAITI